MLYYTRKHKYSHQISKGETVKKQYTDLDIHFTLDGFPVHVLNIIFERFTRVIPSHSHGNGCYEIHYIPAGFGRLKEGETYYDITPNTLAPVRSNAGILCLFQVSRSIPYEGTVIAPERLLIYRLLDRTGCAGSPFSDETAF